MYTCAYMCRCKGTKVEGNNVRKKKDRIKTEVIKTENIYRRKKKINNGRNEKYTLKERLNEMCSIKGKEVKTEKKERKKDVTLEERQLIQHMK